MQLDYLLLFVAIANVSCCIWKVFFEENKELYIDPLTKCYNRNYINTIENKELSGYKYYIAFADIDYFKKINDTYGHEAGDIVLKKFSAILKGSLKKNNDYVIRWGGEEFILLFLVSNPTIFTKEIVFERIENIRKNIENMIIIYNNEEIKITSSFGVCIKNDLELNKQIKKADIALYSAKETGRNKIVLYSDIEDKIPL